MFSFKKTQKIADRCPQTGRFLRGNKFRFSHRDVVIDGKGYRVLAQDCMAGKFFQAIGQTEVK